MQLEAICEEMQETDSLYRFVYERHPDRLAEISRDTIDLLLSSMMLPQLLLSNQSAEKAFSNSMETWHDFNDLNLLYSINTCFSLKNTISDLYETVAAYHTEACDSTFEQFERQKRGTINRRRSCASTSITRPRKPTCGYTECTHCCCRN